jgi:glycosyltransferase involved in cell wall biosynthesis
MSVPLLISDFDWSRSICEEGAIYFDNSDAHDLANKIALVLENKIIQERLIQNGKRMLAKYSTPKKRFLDYQDIIVQECGKHG